MVLIEVELSDTVGCLEIVLSFFFFFCMLLHEMHAILFQAQHDLLMR